jgi:hypothetical protein
MFNANMVFYSSLCECPNEKSMNEISYFMNFLSEVCNSSYVTLWAFIS